MSLSFRPTILKLGGSAITHKQEPFTADLDTIDRLAGEISAAHASHLIIVHGGGSFGHPLAKRYAIKEGYRKETSQAIGFCKTRQSMITLNKLVVDALIKHNIAAVAVSPSSCTVTKSGRIQTLMEEPLKGFLQTGFTPVLYGDATHDLDLGFTILSGDQLAVHLALRLNATRIIMGIDENGLFISDPKLDSSARFVDRITLKELKEIQTRIKDSTATDVTGGMLQKITELMPCVEKGIPSLIVSAREPKNIYRILKGERGTGTIIEKG